MVGNKIEQFTLGLEWPNQDRSEGLDLKLAASMRGMNSDGPWFLVG